jgi:hypothetical protein
VVWYGDMGIAQGCFGKDREGWEGGGGACGADWGEERCMQGFGGET